MKREYHQTEINMFFKCGLQHEFRYLKGIKTPPSGALTIGSSVDTGVTFNLEQKIETGVDLPIDDVKDATATEFERRRPETDWKDDEPGECKDLAVRLATLHHTVIAPTIKPATVQEKFFIELDAPFNIGGTIDLTTEDDIIVDTKTSGKKYTPDSVNNSVQPVLYDYAFEALRGRKAKSFRYDVLIKNKTPITQQVEDVVAPESRDFLFRGIHQVDRAIKAGIALPAPDGAWWCSKDWCGYWNQCKGKKK